jgi:zinc protease
MSLYVSLLSARSFLFACVLLLGLSSQMVYANQDEQSGTLKKTDTSNTQKAGFIMPDLPGVSRTMLIVSPEIPMLDMQIKMDVGSSRDPIGKEGLAQLTSALIATATGRLTETQIQDQVADLALRWSARVDVDAATFSLRVVSKQEIASAAVALWIEALTDAVFDQALFDREKQNLMESLKQLDKDPSYRQEQALMAHLYPNSVYSRSTSVASLEKISLNDVRKFYQTYYPSAYRSLAVVGDIDESRLMSLVHFPSAWQIETKSKFNLLEFDQAASSMLGLMPELKQHLAISQAHVSVVVAVPNRQHKDVSALLVADNWLGGGFGSKITDVIREQNGMAYSAGSIYRPFYDRGVWEFFLQTKNDQFPRALDMLHQVLDDAMNQGISDMDLKRVKQTLINGFALKVDNNQKRLNWLSTLSYYDLPFDYLSAWRDRISAVSRDNVNQVLRNYLSANRRVSSVISGPSINLP